MENPAPFEAPHPGSPQMPRWTTNELPMAPVFTWRNWVAMIGPGLVLGAAAVGGGEWLLGPSVTARYGGALLWVATVSILIQVMYNIEISRYTLYCGEPIFTGKFRIPPGPWFWLFVYLAFDFGALLPYLATNAATPLYSLYYGYVPAAAETATPDFQRTQKIIATGIFLACLLPLVVGGKVYNSLKVIMTTKLVLVFGLLLTLGIFFASTSSWWEIASGFAKIGTVPVKAAEDRNGNGLLDPGEDFDRDGRLDALETFQRDEKKQPVKDAAGHIVGDLDGDGKEDGDNLDNIFTSLFSGRGFPQVNLELIALICALGAIAGNGGLTNSPISNFTRDQGWGMGQHVGAIPSVIGGRGITLSHEGSVFEVNDKSLPRWRGWMRHVRRDQLCIWMVACFIGVALPSILSVEFLKRGTVSNSWTTGALTADGVQARVTTPPDNVLASQLGLASVISGPRAGRAFWYATLFCGFVVMLTSQITTMDGYVRRWVDVFWTASPQLRRMPISTVGQVYFGMLVAYCLMGVSMIWLIENPTRVLTLSTILYNFVFGLSAWHTVVINSTLLPKPLRPHWAIRLFLALGGCVFIFAGAIAAIKTWGELVKV